MFDLIDHARIKDLSIFNDYLVGLSYDVTKHGGYDRRRFNAGAPSAFGTEFGDYHFGFSAVHDAQHRVLPYNPISGIGIGFGDSERFLGMDNFFGISSVSPWSGEGFAHDSYFGVKLHRNILQYTFVAIGCENLFGFGRDKHFLGAFYLNTSQLIPLWQGIMILTLGIGTGRFYTSNYNSLGSQPYKNITAASLFGSVSYLFNKDFTFQLSKVVDTFSSFVSVTPFRVFGVRSLSVGVALMDLRDGIERDNLSLTVIYSGSF